MRRTTAVAAMPLGAVVALMALSACNSKTTTSPGTPTTAAPGSLATATTTVAPTSSASATPTATPTQAKPDELAYVAGGRVHVATVTAAGVMVGNPVLLGPIDDNLQLSWSPKGRYLAWTDQLNGQDNGSLHIWDSELRHESVATLADFTQEVRAGGTGARSVQAPSSASVATYDRTGKITGTQPIGDSQDEIALGPDPQTLVQVGGTEAKADTLELVSPTGAKRVVGQVKAVSFLGDQVVPGLGEQALSEDVGTLAIAGALGQDGGCAPNALLHRIPLDGSGSDAPLVLPEVNGDPSVEAEQISFSGTGTIGVLLAECRDGGATGSAFVELKGSTWKTVSTGIGVAALGPDGLLARRLGGLAIEDYTPKPTGTQPLQVVTSSGAVTLSLGEATYAVGTVTQPATPALLGKEIGSLTARLRLWTPTRWGAAVEPWGTRADLGRHLAQSLADTAAALEGTGLHDLPVLHPDLLVSDQLAVTGDDLVRLDPDEQACADAVAHVLAHRFDLLGEDVPTSLGGWDTLSRGRTVCLNA